MCERKWRAASCFIALQWEMHPVLFMTVWVCDHFSLKSLWGYPATQLCGQTLVYMCTHSHKCRHTLEWNRSLSLTVWHIGLFCSVSTHTQTIQGHLALYSVHHSSPYSTSQPSPSEQNTHTHTQQFLHSQHLRHVGNSAGNATHHCMNTGTQCLSQTQVMYTAHNWLFYYSIWAPVVVL